MRDPREVGGGWTAFQDHWYGEPAADLAPYVAHYWAVSWDLRGQPPYRQKIVPYPQVHLSFLTGSEDAALVRGVARGFVVRTLDGRGRVFGVAFRPGCFRPLLRRPVSTITDRTLPAAEIFDGAALPGEATTATVDAFLLARRPAPDPVTETAAGLVDRIATTPGLTRVDALAADAGLSVRSLQRLFSEYVGVAPKWVIRRYRLHEITERLAAGTGVDWAATAAELGYADQAHLTRDFTKLVGEPPTAYAERYPSRLFKT
ncbi:helix-turn-helix domain-containing protein [Virgisporangium aurantiacum]|uniref:AraC family transcriptional regulator n=1 Tax=Virgisporangium aurantiacum TaxID=175570 RepID=A0A8J3Z836_9ACTN|nr:helix-turn-helix domain-containing protein [Virgisporangium aurantiacum]GIJ58787.1 AraC family transcriptional regulator [Virgisporangium aurantiacum]